MWIGNTHLTLNTLKNLEKNPLKTLQNPLNLCPRQSLFRRATHKRSLEKDLATALQWATTEKVNHWWSEGTIVKTWMRSRALPVEPTANSLPPSTWNNWMRYKITSENVTQHFFGLYIITRTPTKHSLIWAQLFNTCVIH